jgi:hypothetical protein
LRERLSFSGGFSLVKKNIDVVYMFRNEYLLKEDHDDRRERMEKERKENYIKKLKEEIEIPSFNIKVILVE